MGIGTSGRIIYVIEDIEVLALGDSLGSEGGYKMGSSYDI